MVYRTLKRLFIALVPEGMRTAYARQLRWGVYQFYRGGRYQCNLCGAELRAFIGPDRVCPKCGSLARGRRLYTLIEAELERRPLAATRVLHLSPSGPVAAKIAATFPGLNYERSDYLGEFAAEASFDLRDTQLPSASYDLIVCYHILEHIVEDDLAMRELYRLLRPGGVCFVQTPFVRAEGDSVEDATRLSPEQRLEAFGQADHVRIYSVVDLRRRLERVGFAVELRFFPAVPAGRVTDFKVIDEYVLEGRKG